MKTLHRESFGPASLYEQVIKSVERNKNYWRKVSNLLNNTRRYLISNSAIDPQLQIRAAEEYATQALTDTKLPDHVKSGVKAGMMKEFKFKFHPV